MEDPTTIANQALSIRTENLPDDFYKTFLSNLNEVGKDDVIESANKFFLIDNAQIVVTGKIRDIMDKLENISLDGKKIEVVYHDHFGNIVDKPDYSIDSNITVETIVKNYIDAIGGKEKLSKILSIETNATANIQGTVLEIYSLKNNQNQSLMEMSAMGITIAKTVFNKYQGFNEVNAQRIPLTEVELEQAIINSALFSELNFDFSLVELVGTSDVEGEKAYEIKVTDNKSVFYSVDTGLKLKEVESQEVEGNLIVNETFYKEYEEVEGILLPKVISQVSPAIPIPGGITFKATSIKLNVETSDSDFN